MSFKKQFYPEDFLKVLNGSWQKTSMIAEKVGCKRQLTTQTLLNLYEIVKVGEFKGYDVYNSIELVECRFVKGGREGTREWRLKKVPALEKRVQELEWDGE